MRMSSALLRNFCCCFLLYCTAFPAGALELFALQLEEIVGDGWRMAGIEIHAKYESDGTMGVTATVSSLELPADGGQLSQLEWRCDRLFHGEAGYRCLDGRLRVAHSPLGAQELALDLHWDGADNYRLSFAGMQYAGGRITGELRGQPEGWAASLHGRDIGMSGLAEWLPPDLRGDIETLAGRLETDIELQGGAGKAERLSAKFGLRGLSFADKAGLRAAEGLVARMQLDATRDADGWRGGGSVMVPQGQLYVDPLFVDTMAQPLRFDFSGRASGELDDFALKQLRLEAGDLFRLEGSAALASTRLDQPDLDLLLVSGKAGGLYKTVLQPFAIGTEYDDMEVEGAVSLRLAAQRGVLQRFQMDLKDVYLEDRQGRFGLAGLAGQLNWQADRVVGPSRLRVAGGHSYRLEFGATEIPFETSGKQIRLLDTVTVPMLGGRIVLRGLEARGLEAEERFWRLEAAVEAISLQQASEALQWPPLEGSLNGRIPSIRLERGELSLDGLLTAEVFGGSLSVSRFQIRDLFDVAPVLESDITLKGFDLEQLTQTFSFGRIEGRLDGQIQGLQLIAWQPNRFHAHFHTPLDDDSRHRISQRAVDNLTSIGSGVSGGLSSSFLRFFEDFGYDRIELKVDLEGAMAELDGIAHSGGGYYLVKGSGLPRIDVIGRNRRIAWKDLVDRLRNIRTDGAVIQ